MIMFPMMSPTKLLPFSIMDSNVLSDDGGKDGTIYCENKQWEVLSELWQRVGEPIPCSCHKDMGRLTPTNFLCQASIRQQ